MAALAASSALAASRVERLRSFCAKPNPSGNQRPNYEQEGFFTNGAIIDDLQAPSIIQCFQAHCHLE
jgi:hypothetical protein